MPVDHTEVDVRGQRRQLIVFAVTDTYESALSLALVPLHGTRLTEDIRTDYDIARFRKLLKHIFLS